MDTHLKNSVHSFNRTEVIEDVFDEKARKEVDERCEITREEYVRGDTPVIEPQLEVPQRETSKTKHAKSGIYSTKLVNELNGMV